MSHHFLQIHLRSVHLDRIPGHFQRRNLPVGVLVISLLNFLKNSGIIRLFAPGRQFLGPALCPDLRCGSEEDLHRGLGQYHRANVPAVHNYVVLPGNLPLHLQKQIPNQRLGRHKAGFLGDILGADVPRHIHAVHDHMLNTFLIIFHGDVQFIDIPADSVGIFGADSPQIEEIRYCAVNGTGVYIIIPQFLQPHK